ncbi:MAG: hypothetical protein KGL39_12650 [Patescibacteria group bacterium]|nr:hypothetical protein [Patescibacteria group bacterium]
MAIINVEAPGLNKPFLLTYAGVPFCLDFARVWEMPFPTPEGEDSQQRSPKKQQPMSDLVDELNRIIPFQYLQDEVLPKFYTNPNLNAIAARLPVELPKPDVRIGDWYYPNSASRWSVFRGLATSTQAAQMLQNTQGSNPAQFIMRSVPLFHTTPIIGTGGSFQSILYTLSTNMYMLPPRPLAEHGSRYDGLYLITLVDERYWWQFQTVTLQFHNPNSVTRGSDGFLGPRGQSSWRDLIAQVEAVLAINIGSIGIPAVYGFPEPDSQLWANEESAPFLMDCLAYNVGDTFVRWLDGEYKFMSAPEAQYFVGQNRGKAEQVNRTAGGDIYQSGRQGLPVSRFPAINTYNVDNMGNPNPIPITNGVNFLARNTVPPTVRVTFPKFVQNSALGNLPNNALDLIPFFPDIRNSIIGQRGSSWYRNRVNYPDVVVIPVPLASGGSIFGQNPLLQGTTSPVSGLQGTQLPIAINTQPFVSGLPGTTQTFGGQTLTSGSYVGLSGFWHTIHDTAKALYPDLSSVADPKKLPSNINDLTQLAMQLAADYYDRQLMSALDEVYPGTFTWTPEAVHDIVWTYSARSRQATTRVLRSPWNQITREMQHATPTRSLVQLLVPYNESIIQSLAAAGNSVDLTVQDSYGINTSLMSGVIVGTLANPLQLTDTAAYFQGIDNLPTQNRWRGLVSGEIVLFEGTSGGTLQDSSNNVQVSIAGRGVDGTQANSGTIPVNSFVSGIVRNINYKTNLITFQKGQFIYPGWNSGGIQEAVIVPQTQTVQVLDSVGTQVNGVQVYSGQIELYDLTQQGSTQQVGQEFIWVMERNSQSPTQNNLYDGQIVGYSAAPPLGMHAKVAPGAPATPLAGGTFLTPAPMYAINIGGGTTTTTSDASFLALLTGPLCCCLNVQAAGGGLPQGQYYVFLTAIFQQGEFVFGDPCPTPTGALCAAGMNPMNPHGGGGVNSVSIPSTSNGRGAIKVCQPPQPPGATGGWNVYAIGPDVCTGFQLINTTGTLPFDGMTNFIIGSIPTPPPDNPPPAYSYYWSEVEAFESAWAHGNADIPNCAFRVKNGGKSGKSYDKPAWEVANCIFSLGTGGGPTSACPPTNADTSCGCPAYQQVIARLRPAFNNPTDPLGQEYEFEGGYTGNIRRVTQITIGACTFTAFGLTDHFYNGRLIYSC